MERAFTTRVIFSLLRPAVRLADGEKLSLKGVANLAQLALYRSKKSRGLTLKEISDELAVSPRTADRLAKSLRDDFFEPERDHELPRRLEFMLWAGPKGRARLYQLLPDTPEEEIDEALELLVSKGRIEPRQGRTLQYHVTHRANRLPDDSQAARVDALNHLMDVLGGAVLRRFFGGDQRAGARNVAMRVVPEDIARIEAIYEEHVWPALVELDERAESRDDAVEMGLTMLWTPLDS